MPISTETTHSRKAARHNDGCQLQKCWIWPQDRRQSRSENTIKAKNVRHRGVWLKNFLPCTTEDVHVLKRFFGNIHGISRVCAHSVVSNKANNCPNRQQVSHTFFPNKGNSASTLECMCFCVAI